MDRHTLIPLVFIAALVTACAGRPSLGPDTGLPPQTVEELTEWANTCPAQTICGDVVYERVTQGFPSAEAYALAIQRARASLARVLGGEMRAIACATVSRAENAQGAASGFRRLCEAGEEAGQLPLRGQVRVRHPRMGFLVPTNGGMEVVARAEMPLDAARDLPRMLPQLRGEEKKEIEEFHRQWMDRLDSRYPRP